MTEMPARGADFISRDASWLDAFRRCSVRNTSVLALNITFARVPARAGGVRTRALGTKDVRDDARAKDQVVVDR